MLFAKVLRMLREARGISQYKLAKILNTTPSLISRYESGQRCPRRETVRAIAEALDLTPEERRILYHSAGFIADEAALMSLIGAEIDDDAAAPTTATRWGIGALDIAHRETG